MQISIKYYSDIPNGTTVKFYDNKNYTKIKEIELRSRDIYQLISGIYTKIYKKISTTEIGLKRKNSVEHIERNITNAEELEEFIKNYRILVLSKNILDDLSEFEKGSLISQFYFICNINNTIGYSEERTKEFNSQYGKQVLVAKEAIDDIDIIKDYIKENPDFFTKDIRQQHNIISCLFKKKYLDKKEYDLDDIINYIRVKKNKLGIELKPYYKFENEEISEIFSLLTKAVFLTHKERTYDIDTSTYDNIDLTGIRINQKKGNIFTKLKNAFTHYRYEYKSDTRKLDTEIHLYDIRRSGEETVTTFDADTDLYTCFKTVLHINFLEQISQKYKSNDDKEIELSDEETDLFIAKKLLNNKGLFKNLQEEKKKNYDLCEIAILMDYKNVRFVDKEIKEDRNFMLKIIKEQPEAFEYLNEYWQDEEFFKEAISRNGNMILFVDSKNWNEENILLALSSNNVNISSIISILPYELSKSIDFLRKSIMANPIMIHFAIQEKENNKNIEDIFNDKEVAMNVASKDGSYIRYFSRNIRADFDIAIKAIENSAYDEDVDKSLFENEEFCNKAKEIKERREKEAREKHNNYRDEKMEKAMEIVLKLRDKADKKRKRDSKQSEIEEALNLDRLNEEDVKTSEKILEELRKQGESISISTLYKIRNQIWNEVKKDSKEIKIGE